MSTAFITFVYPAATRFFEGFIQSLNNQTDKEFTLVVFNDGCNESELNCFFENNTLSVEIVTNRCTTISKNRFRAFHLLSNSMYSHFIFGDIDDLFSENRVQLVKKALTNHEIVFNELDLTSEGLNILKPNLIKGYLGLIEEITFEMVKYKNLIGFSHVAMGKEAISFLAQKQINKEITVVDWAIIAKLLTKWNAYFEANATTYYVMHENNIALENEYTYNSFLKEVEIKFQQYKENSNLDLSLARELNNLRNLKALIVESRVTMNDWGNLVIDKNNDYYPWWNKLKHDEELENEIQIRTNKKL